MGKTNHCNHATPFWVQISTPNRKTAVIKSGHMPWPDKKMNTTKGDGKFGGHYFLRLLPWKSQKPNSDAYNQWSNKHLHLLQPAN